MQTPEKNSLFTAMNRFIGAVNNMDQTVMVPSLLRDVPLPQRDAERGSALREAEADMFTYYTHLKAIRNEIEWGGLREDQRRHLGEEGEEGTDLEQLLLYHLKGLNGVLGKLTSQANYLTNRYKQEIGIAGWGQ